MSLNLISVACMNLIVFFSIFIKSLRAESVKGKVSEYSKYQNQFLYIYKKETVQRSSL